MTKLTYKDLEERIRELEKLEKVHLNIESSLRESEYKYRSITENIALGIFRSTPGPKGKFIEVNKALVDMLGYASKEELLKINVSDIYLDPADRGKFADKISKIGFLRNEELAFVRKNGTPFIVSDTAILVLNSSGEIIYFDGIVEDITERKKAEEELRIQKIYFEELVKSAPEGIVLHDRNDRVISVNIEFEKMFGYTQEESKGQLLNDLIADGDLREEANKMSDTVLNCEGVNTEKKRRRKDGTLIDVSVLGAPIIHEGKLLGVYVIYRDITERKKAEEEILLQKSYFVELFNSAPEAIVLHDNQDIILDINKEFTAMFGYSAEEAVGKKINDLIATNEFLANADNLSRQVINGKRVNEEAVRRRKDGSQIEVSILGAPITHNGQQKGVYAIYRDITDSKRAEEERIKSSEQGRMAKDIQQNLLPKSVPDIEGFEIIGINKPADVVGGDYFDIIQLDDHRFAITVGDVSGKGLPASLVMANLQATIRGQAFFNTTAKQCLEMANKLLFRSTNKQTFVSLFYGILDTTDNTLCYANAGQNMPYLLSCNKQIIPLETRGMALGLVEDAEYPSEKISLNSGDILLIYTDGITEAMNANQEEFGDERLIELMKNHCAGSAEALVSAIMSEATTHIGCECQNDDITMIVLKKQ